MSIIATYVRLSSDAFERLRGRKDWMEVFFANGVPGAEMVDIDKACDGLVWLLSRMPAPPSVMSEGAGFVLLQSRAPLLRGEGGRRELRLVGPYGPASSLSVAQVVELSAWLQGMEEATLRIHYDPKRMEEEQVYPDIWIEEGMEAFEEYLLPSFRTLREFFVSAAQARQEVLVFFV